MSFLNLKNKIAIIAGGVSGIGYETAKLLLQNDVSCILWDKNEKKGKEVLSELKQIGPFLGNFESFIKLLLGW
ncbi:SDR family NAD(P)-dependent oxidoreductase [Geminocystis sp. GBBB08]|uniref:SDR family NAD(P)-dependent oxidoreductase n=1 Tax=Geminocystis sp. GBBB08 TaxID=2604140 RepID=UPI0027E2D766|nr:SDR family NAD(P)-dependent oxidoreductase [Geminocystis sp. GBBB08]MBL1208514.1 SDR family oxidoreductase [Geminocystis sp. GBBB08]